MLFNQKQTSYVKRDLHRKLSKLKRRLEKNIKSGNLFSLSLDKRKQLISRYQRYARKLKVAGLSAAFVTFLLCADPSTASAQYTECPTNPFAAVSEDRYIHPAYKDIDGDGDVDMVYGEYYGKMIYYENNGGVFTEQTGANNPFDGIIAETANGGDDYVGYYATPTFADIDGDGDCDLVFGAYYTTGDNNGFFYYENNGGVFTELTGAANPFLDIADETYTAPVFVDIDGDGDLDLISGNEAGEIEYFENIGGTYTVQTGANNPFDAVGSNTGESGHSKPAFKDVDGDGDLDLVVGFGNQNNADLYYYENIGGVYTFQTGANNPFDAIQMPTTEFLPWVGPAFADIDGDGQDELLITYRGDTNDHYIISYCLPPLQNCDNINPGVFIKLGDQGGG